VAELKLRIRVLHALRHFKLDHCMKLDLAAIDWFKPTADGRKPDQYPRLTSFVYCEPWWNHDELYSEVHAVSGPVHALRRSIASIRLCVGESA
jgi:hypothetical protein